MLANDLHVIQDPAVVRSLIDRFGWVVMASDGAGSGPVVSHLPVVLEDDDRLSVLGHLARVDADEHALGRREVSLVVQGPHGYISPTLYGAAGPYVPTWNFITVHLHGVPTLLDEAETWQVLERTVEHFEQAFTSPWRLGSVREYAESLLPHVSGFRLRPDRVVTKSKVSQDKPPDVVARVLDGLSGPGEYADPTLADAMRERLG